LPVEQVLISAELGHLPWQQGELEIINLPTFRRNRWLVLLLLSSVAVLAVACGGGDDSDDATPTSQPPAASDNSPLGTNNPFNIPGLGTGASDDVDCSSITAAAGIPGAAFAIGASDTPTTEFSEKVSEFFTDLIENALSVDADVTCFFEISAGEDGAGMWMSYSLSESAGTNAVSLLTQELVSEGVETDSSSSFSANFGQGAFSFIGFESIPGVDADSGGLMMVSGDSIVVTAGSDFGSDDSDDDSPFGGVVGGGGDTPTGGALDDLIASAVSGGGGTTTATPVISIGGAVSLTGATGEVNDVLEPALEAALGVSLEVSSSFSTDSGGTTTAIFAYDVSGTISVDLTEAFTDVVTEFGGTVDFSFSAGDATNVTFSGASIAGLTVGGSLNAADEIAVTLQITS
jgi:hypothetical protein